MNALRSGSRLVLQAPKKLELFKQIDGFQHMLESCGQSLLQGALAEIGSVLLRNCGSDPEVVLEIFFADCVRYVRMREFSEHFAHLHKLYKSDVSRGTALLVHFEDGLRVYMRAGTLRVVA